MSCQMQCCAKCDGLRSQNTYLVDYHYAMTTASRMSAMTRHFRRTTECVLLSFPGASLCKRMATSQSQGHRRCCDVGATPTSNCGKCRRICTVLHDRAITNDQCGKNLNKTLNLINHTRGIFSS